MHLPLVKESDAKNPEDAFDSLQEELNKLDSIMRKADLHDEKKTITYLLAVMAQVALIICAAVFLIIPSNKKSIHYQQEYEDHDCDYAIPNRTRDGSKCSEIYNKLKLPYAVVVATSIIGSLLFTLNVWVMYVFIFPARANLRQLHKSKSNVLKGLSNIIADYNQQTQVDRDAPMTDNMTAILVRLYKEPAIHTLATSKIHPDATQAHCLIYLILLLRKINVQITINNDITNKIVDWASKNNTKLTHEVFTRIDDSLSKLQETENKPGLTNKYSLQIERNSLVTLTFLKEFIKNNSLDQIISQIEEKIAAQGPEGSTAYELTNDPNQWKYSAGQFFSFLRQCLHRTQGNSQEKQLYKNTTYVKST